MITSMRYFFKCSQKRLLKLQSSKARYDTFFQSQMYFKVPAWAHKNPEHLLRQEKMSSVTGKSTSFPITNEYFLGNSSMCIIGVSRQYHRVSYFIVLHKIIPNIIWDSFLDMSLMRSQAICTLIFIKKLKAYEKCCMNWKHMSFLFKIIDSKCFLH